MKGEFGKRSSKVLFHSVYDGFSVSEDLFPELADSNEIPVVSMKIITEARKEFPLMIPPSPLHSKELIIDYMIDTMKWFEKWFGI